MLIGLSSLVARDLSSEGRRYLGSLPWVVALMLLSMSTWAATERELEAVRIESLDGTPLNAWVLRPLEPETPRGAVVALHGCGGLYANVGSRKGRLSARHQMWAETLARAGFVAIFPDSLTTRGETELCTQRAQARKVTQRERRNDALGALRWAAAQPTGLAGRLALMGWSHGGSAVLSATDAAHADVAALPAAARPRLALAFYPGCAVALRTGYRPAAPLVMLLGAADDWTAPGPCIELGQSVEADVQVYEGAHHGFDAPVGMVRHLPQVPNGVNPGKGVHAGPNPAARDAAHKHVLKVLDAAFAPASNGQAREAR